MNPKRPRNFYLVLILGSLTALSPFSIDMYLPAFQKIASDFGVQVSDVSLSLSSYFIGLASGQLLYGPLLDRFGRKPPLYAGLLIFIAATFGCMFSRSIEVLVFFRFVQAVGGCSAQVASIAMVRDFFDKKEGAKIFSLLILILGVSPLLAPTTGAFLAAYFSWQSVFIALALIATLLLAIVFFFLPEGHQPDPTQSLRLRPIIKNYLSILRNPQFYTYTLGGALAFSGLFVYLASSPVIFLEIFKVSPQAYSWIFGILAAGFISSSQFNILLMKKYSSEQILKTALFCLTSVGLLFFSGAYFGLFEMTGTIILLFCYLSSAGVINPNASALALAPFTKNAGSASALMGSFQMGIGAILSVGASLIHTQEVFPYTIIFATTAVLALMLLLFGRSRISRYPREVEPVLS